MIRLLARRQLRLVFLDYEENIDKVLQEMKDAGLDTYVAEYQRQFSEYYASVHAE